jgi:hypothetical protein
MFRVVMVIDRVKTTGAVSKYCPGLSAITAPFGFKATQAFKSGAASWLPLLNSSNSRHGLACIGGEILSGFETQKAELVNINGANNKIKNLATIIYLSPTNKLRDIFVFIINK